MTDLEQTKRDLTAATLNQYCLEFLKGHKLSTFETGLILGIILGVEDDASYDKKIVIPINVSEAERVQVISNYIQNNPKRQHQSFASLAFDAMLEQWPYQK
ncbi:MAG: hypothetical protein ACOYK2_01020 [Polynucleobacter sp.]